MRTLMVNANKVHLHTDKRIVLFLIALFSVFSFLVNIFVFVAMNTRIGDLYSLINSKYVYSASSLKGIGSNEYIKFDAGITFVVSPESDRGINSEVIMQSNESEYDGLLYWNPKLLQEDEIAISKGIAESYKLEVGSKLYSKHGVDSTYHEYTVKQIIPEISRTQVNRKNVFLKGIIIMGEDQNYLKNLSHEYVIFADAPVNEIVELTNNSLANIVYRDDEIKIVISGLAPYLILSLISSLAFVIILAMLCVKQVTCNYKRLATLGFEQNKMESAYRANIYGSGLSMIIIEFILNMSATVIIGINSIEVMFWCLNLGLQSVTLCIAVEFQRTRLWRK